MVKSSKGKRKWKSLTLKVEHLRLELEERNETIEEITKEFLDMLAQVAEADPVTAESKVPRANEARPAEAQQDGHETGEASDHPTAEDKEIPEEIKSLWKQIAKVAHPDKTGGDERKTELYKRAASAMASGDIDEIVAVANELGFDLPEASDASVDRLEKVAKDLQGRLNNLENSVIWQWSNAPPSKRATILALYMKSKGLRPKKNS